MKLRGSKVAVREFLLTLQNDVFLSVHPPTRSVHNRRCDAGDREEVGDAIARREIKKYDTTYAQRKKLRADCFGVP